MHDKFSIKQIAAQAGLSTATVDRVLNQRAGVRYQTKLRVNRAVEELEEQQGLVNQFGRTLYVDIIMQAPKRFTDAVKQAILASMASLPGCRIHPRFHLFESIALLDLNKLILACKSNGSYGVILKAPNDSLINQAINQLFEHEVPVVTLVTDLPQSMRLAYIGMDNRAAGRTAAYMMGRLLKQQETCVAVVLSHQEFRGEEEREMGFRGLIREQFSHIKVVDILGGQGLYQATYEKVKHQLEQDSSINAVYSVGGGNLAILDAFDALSRPIDVFIGHDLDQENKPLLREGKLDSVIDHNLEADARRAFSYLLQFHKIKPQAMIPATQINLVTPYNF